MAENIKRAATGQPEGSRETCLPESELVVFCVTRGRWGVASFPTPEQKTIRGSYLCLWRVTEQEKCTFPYISSYEFNHI